LRTAGAELKIDELFIVYPGKEQFPLDKNIQAIGLSVLIEII
jgi:hypothetical protein